MLQFLLGFLLGGLVCVLFYRRMMEPVSGLPRNPITITPPIEPDARPMEKKSKSKQDKTHSKKHPKEKSTGLSVSGSSKERSKRLSGDAKKLGVETTSEGNDEGRHKRRDRSSNSFKASKSLGHDDDPNKAHTPKGLRRKDNLRNTHSPSKLNHRRPKPPPGHDQLTRSHSHSLMPLQDLMVKTSIANPPLDDTHMPQSTVAKSVRRMSPRAGGEVEENPPPTGFRHSGLVATGSMKKRGHRRNVSLTGYNRDSEVLDEICRRFSDRNSGVRLKQIDRKLRAGKIRVQKYVFSGADGVNWLLGVDGVNTREAAIHLGLSMWAKGYFRHIKHPHRPFCDEKNEFFRFARDEKHASAKQALRESLLKQHLTPGGDSEAQSEAHTKEWLKTISGWVQILCRKEKGSDKADWERFWCKFTEDEDGAWKLELYTDIEDKDVIRLVLAMHDNETGLRYHKRDRLSRKSIVSDKVCFQGRSAVKWCLKTGKTTNRMEAVNLMTSLLSKGIISPLDADEFGPFQDKKDTLYYFTKFAEGKRWRRQLGDGNRKVVGKTLDSLMQQPAILVGCLDFRASGELMLKLEKSRGKIQVVLSLDPPAPLAFKDEGAESLLVDSNVFKVQLREKDDLRVKNWVFAFQMCVLFSSSAYVHEIDETYVPTDESDTDNSDISPGTDDTDDELDELRSSSGSAEEPKEGEGVEIAVSSGDSADSLREEKKRRKKGSKRGERRGKKKKFQPKPELLNAAEKAVLVELKRKLVEEKAEGVYEETGHDLTLISDRVLVKYLRARRLDVDLGLQLLKNGVAYRAEHGLENIMITEIFQEIHGDTGGAMVSTDPKARDRDGRMVFIVFTEHYNPRKTSGYDIVRAIYYLIESVYEEDEETERTGFTLIVDCKNSKYSNFDARMPGQVINGIVGKFPGRVGHVILINTPWYFKFVWRIIKSLLSAYLVQKFHIVPTLEAIQEWVSPENLLPEHGGTAEYDFNTWIRKRFAHDGVDYEDFIVSRGLKES